MSIDTLPTEHQDLNLHVNLCEQRYRALETRLDKLEEKLAEIDAKVDRFRLDFFKIMVGTAGSIIIAIIGAVAAIKWH